MTRCGIVLIWLLLLTCISVSSAPTAVTKSVMVYYYDWDVSVRSALTVENVRERFYTKIEIVDADEAEKFAKIITSKNYQKTAPPNGVDVRLVIDLYSAEGRVTYFASYFRLYSGDFSSSVEIDEAFRNKFRFAN